MGCRRGGGPGGGTREGAQGSSGARAAGMRAGGHLRFGGGAMGEVLVSMAMGSRGSKWLLLTNTKNRGGPRGCRVACGWV